MKTPTALFILVDNSGGQMRIARRAASALAKHFKVEPPQPLSPVTLCAGLEISADYKVHGLTTYILRRVDPKGDLR
jgi:hypothetical protein